MLARRAGTPLLGLLMLAATSVAAASPERAGDTRAASWLDAPLANWNRSFRALPRAPKPAGEPPATPRCAHLIRPAAGAEDRALVAAGWTPVGALQVLGDLTLIKGVAAVDAMCRPLGYQVFAYVGGRPAGTLAPAPMNSCSDGAAAEINGDGGERLQVAFARYAADDAPCHPRRLDVVVYRVDRGAAGPLLVPVEVLRGAAR